MNDSLIGLPLEEALKRLRASGTEPEVQITAAPRYREKRCDPSAMRVLRVSGDGKRLTAAPFAYPGTDKPAESQD